MCGARGEILYVGKAKNLRARLKSYRNVRPEKLPRKTQKLIEKVHSIHWDPLPTETAALLRENEWLRALKPPFNVANTRPESYLFVALSNPKPEELEIKLAFGLKEIPQEALIFGAFKGIGAIRRAQAASLRWAWAKLNGHCDWPVRLARATAPLTSRIEGEPSEVQEVFDALSIFYAGYLPLPELVIPEDSPHSFLQSRWRDDQILLESFFRTKARRHLHLLVEVDSTAPAVEPERLDDLLVLRRHAREEASSDPQALQHSFADFLLK